MDAYLRNDIKHGELNTVLIHLRGSFREAVLGVRDTYSDETQDCPDCPEEQHSLDDFMKLPHRIPSRQVPPEERIGYIHDSAIIFLKGKPKMRKFTLESRDMQWKYTKDKTGTWSMVEYLGSRHWSASLR
jgi:hypothetical protein